MNEQLNKQKKDWWETNPLCYWKLTNFTKLLDTVRSET